MFPTNLLFLVHTALLTTSYAAFLNVRDDETLIAGASLRAWNDLNTTIGGRLHVGEPFEKACFSTFNGNPINPDASACSALQQNYTNPLFRVQQFGAYMLVSSHQMPDQVAEPHFTICSLNGRRVKRLEMVAF